MMLFMCNTAILVVLNKYFFCADHELAVPFLRACKQSKHCSSTLFTYNY